MHSNNPSTDKARPLFSVIILCWNSSQTISKCLAALDVQTFQDFEIILVDNGSTTPIPSEMFKAYPGLRIHFFRLESNLGFAGGNNYAASKAKADHLVLLNADAFPRADWLANINLGITKYPNCFYTSKQIMADHPELLDGTGDVYHVSGLAWRRSYNTPVSNLEDRDSEVFSACGAGAVYPTRAFHQVNGFDEDYFSYVEDIDLGFRLRLIGYRCMYLSNAVIHHLGSASTSRRSDLSVFYGQRNLVWTFIKDMPGIWLWVMAPLHLLANLFLIASSAARKQGVVSLSAKREALRDFNLIIRKRSQVQSTRSISSWKVMKAMDWNPFSPIIKRLHN